MIIKNYKNFLESKQPLDSNKKRNINFIHSEDGKKLLNKLTEEYNEDIKDSLIDAKDLGAKIIINNSFSNENGKIRIDGEVYISYYIMVEIPGHNNKMSLDEFEKDLNKIKSIKLYFTETVNRLSEDLKKSYVNAYKGMTLSTNLIAGFLQKIDQEEFNNEYEKWEMNKYLVIKDLLNNLKSILYSLVNFDFDIEHEIIGNNVDFYLTDGTYRLGHIANHELANDLDDFQIYYDEIEEINDDYLEGLEDY
jgi:hypothetical protein